MHRCCDQSSREAWKHGERSPARDTEAAAVGGAGDVLLPVRGGEDGARLTRCDAHHLAYINVPSLSVIIALGFEAAVVIV